MKRTVGLLFDVVSYGVYFGVVAWCGVVGHRPIEGARLSRCRRCFERCDGGAS